MKTIKVWSKSPNGFLVFFSEDIKMLSEPIVTRQLSMNRFVITFSVLVVVGVLASVGFLGLFDANSRNVKVTSDLTKLQEEYAVLQTNYYWLMGNYSFLEWNYTRLLMESPSLVPNPGGSGMENDTYVSRLAALQSLYSSLKTKYDQFVANYHLLRSLTDQRLMRGNAQAFVTPFDPAVMSLMYNVTGKVGNVTSRDVYGRDIQAMYDWVNNNIKYREDGLYPALPYDIADVKLKGLRQTDQMAQFPNETLSLRTGDCEDTAVLLASMIRAYFYDGNSSFTVECIWITGENAGHVAVQILFEGGKLAILDPVRDYCSHDTLGAFSLNSVSSELYSWMNIWRPSLGNDVHVYRVFSDYMDQYFNSTEAYLTWMYNR